MRATDFTIRSFEEKDREAALGMAAESFPLLQRFSLVFNSDVWVLEHAGQIYGMIKGKTITLTSGKRIGVVAWLFINKNSQSRGYGAPLLEKLIHNFQENDCDEMLSCAHHLNTSSSGGMTHFGFEPMPLREQVVHYKHEIFKVWKKAFHVFDYGHLLWCKPLKKEVCHFKNDSFLLHAFFAILVLFFISIRNGNGLDFSLMALGLSYLVGRRLFHLAFLTLFKVGKTRFQGWESGVLLSFLLSFVSGLWFLSPGLDVPNQDRWRVKLWEKPLFWASCSWSVFGLFLCYSINSESFKTFWISTLWLELAFCFFPFEAMTGGWVFRKSRICWLFLFICVTATFGQRLYLF